ncbi:unnamed protein product [Neospora caninum Liverpool]|uniref:AP2 domain transcription factor AP2X-1 n=1 Tax=Neospora caninum (strain Liverpool) TaxID=572307 RepID=F0VLI9_NEOCL|nr:uncharacterized protein NCLIV_045500 [Neospora caninum Liverpool]CBZ54117.1 unnamed protein product [Neospora caninum Liverpool]CEL68816.1 TPA: AP2 domain transcription factor AP2X-1 [Neospora caninum Liverpool]|eukprot:XP_003884148.1 uncharacterized protein NCLIV_045500 [Neospora caninum Liverpool]
MDRDKRGISSLKNDRRASRSSVPSAVMDDDSSSHLSPTAPGATREREEGRSLAREPNEEKPGVSTPQLAGGDSRGRHGSGRTRGKRGKSRSVDVSASAAFPGGETDVSVLPSGEKSPALEPGSNEASASLPVSPSRPTSGCVATAVFAARIVSPDGRPSPSPASSGDLSGSCSPCATNRGAAAEAASVCSLSPPAQETGASAKSLAQSVENASCARGRPTSCASAASPPSAFAEREQLHEAREVMKKAKKGSGGGDEEKDRRKAKPVERDGRASSAVANSETEEDTAESARRELSASPQAAMAEAAQCRAETPEECADVSTGDSQGSPATRQSEESFPVTQKCENAPGGPSSKAKKATRENGRQPDPALIHDRHFIFASPSPSNSRKSPTCSPSPHSQDAREATPGSAPLPASAAAPQAAPDPSEKGALCPVAPQEVPPAFPGSPGCFPAGSAASPLSPPGGQAPRPEPVFPGQGLLSLRRSLRHRQPVRQGAGVSPSPHGAPGSSLSSRSASPSRRGGVSPGGPAAAVGKPTPSPGAAKHPSHKAPGAASAALHDAWLKASPSAGPQASFSGKSLLASPSASTPAGLAGPGAPAAKKKAGQVQSAAGKSRGGAPFVLSEYWSGLTLDEMEKGEAAWTRAAAGLLPASPHKTPASSPSLGAPRDEDGSSAAVDKREKAPVGTGRSQATQLCALASKQGTLTLGACVDPVAAVCWGGAGVDSRVLAPQGERVALGSGDALSRKRVHVSDGFADCRAAPGAARAHPGKLAKAKNTPSWDLCGAEPSPLDFLPLGLGSAPVKKPKVGSGGEPSAETEHAAKRSGKATAGARSGALGDDGERGRGRGRDENEGLRFDVSWFLADGDSPLASGHGTRGSRWESLWVRPASPVRKVPVRREGPNSETRRKPARETDDASAAKRHKGDSGSEEAASLELGSESSDSEDFESLSDAAASATRFPAADGHFPEVPRCCYCLLPRRIPARTAEVGSSRSAALGWSQETGQTRRDRLRLYCACTTRAFGESVLQGAAGQRGLLLPVPASSLQYAVCDVTLDGAGGEAPTGGVVSTSDIAPSGGASAGVRDDRLGAGRPADAREPPEAHAPVEAIYRWRDPCTLQTFSSPLDRIQGSLAATAAVAAAAESAGKRVVFLPRLYWDREADCYIASCLRWEDEEAAQPEEASKEEREKTRGAEKPAATRGRGEKKAEEGRTALDPARRRCLKLLQKKFSVAFLGDAKAHFYASEWLRWQHNGHRAMMEERKQEIARQLASPLLAGRRATAKGPGVGGAGAKRGSALSAAQLALASGRPLTPEEEEELRRQIENKERQKKQKLLRQQWRRQQAREAKLRLQREAEEAAAAAAAAAAAGAGQTRSPQSQQKSALSLSRQGPKNELPHPCASGASLAPAAAPKGGSLVAGEFAGAGPSEGVGTRRSTAAAGAASAEKGVGRKGDSVARDTASLSLDAPPKSTMVTRGGGRGPVAVTRSVSSPSGRASGSAGSPPSGSSGSR